MLDFKLLVEASGVGVYLRSRVGSGFVVGALVMPSFGILLVQVGAFRVGCLQVCGLC